MQLDEMKQAWTAHGAMLERSLAIDERLLREVLLGRVKGALRPHILWRALEVAFGVVMLAVLVPILSAHRAEPRYVVVGGTLALFTVLITALSAHLLVRSLALDYGGPVTTMQRDVERIRIVEYRALKWAVLGGVVVWLPASLILFEALTAVDALARVDLAWLIGNLVFGLVILAAGLLLSRRYVERPDLGPIARRLVDALSGRGPRSAAALLAELARFEREE
jgi:hypothetical protein